MTTTRERSIRQKQLLAVGGTLAALCLITIAMTYRAETTKMAASGPAPAATKPINLGLTESAVTAERIADAQRYQELMQRVRTLEESNRNLAAANRDFNEAVRRSGAVAPPVMEGEGGRAAPVEPPPEPPPAPTRPGAGMRLTGLGPPPPAEAFRSGVQLGANGEPVPSTMRSMDLPAPPSESRAPGAVRVERTTSGESIIADAPLTLNRAAGRTYETFIPPGTFCRVSTLVGLEAPTGGQAQNNPVPAQFEILDDCTLPNGRRAPLRGCFITANGYGDLSAERAYIRLDRLSCIDQDNAAVDIAVRGFVVGEDGKPGMTGTVVNKQGQAIANSIYAAIAGGTGRALRNAGTTQTINPLGTVTETTTDGFKAGMGDGLAKGFDAISQYYLKVAEKLFPVISVASMRTVEVSFSRGFIFETRNPNTPNNRE